MNWPEDAKTNLNKHEGHAKNEQKYKCEENVNKPSGHLSKWSKIVHWRKTQHDDDEHQFGVAAPPPRVAEGPRFTHDSSRQYILNDCDSNAFKIG